MDEVHPNHSHERKSEVDGAVDRPKRQGHHPKSLKALQCRVGRLTGQQEPSKGISIRLAWTSPEKAVEK